jgi:hypothetical protein
MPSEDTLVGVVVPAAFVEIAVREGNEHDAQAKRRHPPNHHVKVWVEKLLTRYPTLVEQSVTPSLIPPPPALLTVEDAAKVIVECLDPEHRNLIQTLAKESQRPLASYIMSPILLAREQGRVGVVIGEWADKKPDQTKSPMPLTSTCEWCGNPFKTTNEGQRFCPSPADGSESCGRKWNMERLHRDPRAVRQAFGPTDFAPLPSQRIAEHTEMMDRLNG